MAKAKSPVKLVSYEEIMGIADCEEVIIIATVAFVILFAGTFIQVLLEEVNAGLRKIMKA